MIALLAAAAGGIPLPALVGMIGWLVFCVLCLCGVVHR